PAEREPPHPRPGRERVLAVDARAPAGPQGSRLPVAATSRVVCQPGAPRAPASRPGRPCRRVAASQVRDPSRFSSPPGGGMHLGLRAPREPAGTSPEGGRPVMIRHRIPLRLDRLTVSLALVALLGGAASATAASPDFDAVTWTPMTCSNPNLISHSNPSAVDFAGDATSPPTYVAHDA